MTNTMKVATPVIPRLHLQRTWLDAKGHIVAPRPVQPAEEASSAVDWEAHVVDCMTDEQIEAYPKLTGTLDIPSGTDQERAVTLMYMDRCRFLDGPKPDVEELQQKVNAGLWDVEVTLRDLEPA